MIRHVDAAMTAERPEKIYIRALWLETIRELRDAFPHDDVPLYLTLSGAEARDIQLLIDNGLIRLTETVAVRTEDEGIAVAIESNSDAAWRLQRKLPGLKILIQPFENLVRSGGMTVWPQGEHVRFCRARVINLDLNEPVKFVGSTPDLLFPPLQWVRKLTVLHADASLDWCLLLTLHGEAVWESAETKSVAEFLSENFGREPLFAEAAGELIGEELFEKISRQTIPAARRLRLEDQQKLLMLYVPKRLIQIALEHGFRAEVTHNLRYGGADHRAPMVSWIVKFHRDRRSATRPDALYRDGLKTILTGAGHIAEDGSLS
jgi:hypothetical protein